MKGRLNKQSEEYLSEHYKQLEGYEDDFRNSNLLNLVLSKLKGKTLLDIGCGRGDLLKKATQNKIDVFGLEPNQKLFHISKQRNPQSKILNIPAEQTIKFIKKRVDNITLLDVLEHVEKDNVLIKDLNKILNKGGRLIIVVPANQYLYGLRDKSAGHFRRYSKKNIREILDQNNFRTLELRYWNMMGFLPYLFYEKVLKKPINEGFRTKNKKSFSKVVSCFLNWWFKKVENNLNLGFGLSIILVAEKT